MSVDPGETTGWALWEGQALIDAGQTPLIEFLDEVANGAAVGWLPPQSRMTRAERKPFTNLRRLVIEEFRIYPWECANLEFDEVRTARGIGALEFIGRHAGLEVVLQPAKIKEAAEEAGARELFRTPLYENRHQNDAIRHGWYYIATAMLGQRVELPFGGSGVVIEG